MCVCALQSNRAFFISTRGNRFVWYKVRICIYMGDIGVVASVGMRIYRKKNICIFCDC